MLCFGKFWFLSVKKFLLTFLGKLRPCRGIPEFFLHCPFWNGQESCNKCKWYHQIAKSFNYYNLSLWIEGLSYCASGLWQCIRGYSRLFSKLYDASRERCKKSLFLKAFCRSFLQRGGGVFDGLSSKYLLKSLHISHYLSFKLLYYRDFNRNVIKKDPCKRKPFDVFRP